MTFFYDLNRKLQQVLDTPKSEHKQLNERAETDESALQAYLGKKKYGEQGMKALQKAGREGKDLAPVRAKYDKMDEASTGDYSAKKARAGKDIGKPGKAFASIAKSAGERYGSKERGEKVAGAVLAKLRAKNEGIEDRLKDLDQSNPVNQPAYQRKAKSGDSAAAARHTPKEGMTAKQKSFAALAPPKDKITFADKIAGAKKEVDEMLGDVAAEAIKGALSPKQKKLDLNKNGKLDANDFAMLRKGAGKEETNENQPTHFEVHYKDNQKGRTAKTKVKGSDAKQAKAAWNDWNSGNTPGRFTFVAVKPVASEMDEGWDEMEKDVKRRMTTRKVGDVTHGAKHDVEEIPGGRRVTRRVDPNTGHSVGADDDTPADGEKRGRGRPKGSKKAMGAKGPSGKSKLMTREGDVDVTDQGEYDQEGAMAKDDIKTIVRHAKALEKVLGDNDNLPEWVQAKLAKIEGMMTAVDDYMQNQQDSDGEELDEKAVSKAQQRFMGMAHAMQKGEKIPGASKELKKVAKSMKPSDTHDFAATKHKGLPEKKKADAKKDDGKSEDKPKRVKEQGGVDTPTASSGFSFGKGIYDSMNHELETMIAESMNVSMNMSNDANGGPSKSLTVTATDDDAIQLGKLLKMAGLGDEGGETAHVEVSGPADVADQIRQAMGDHEHGEEEPCPDCGSTDCGCDHEQEVDEAAVNVSDNQPNWPTNTETSDDALQYAGGLNKPKTDVAGDGQTTIPNTAVHTQAEDELRRLREMAGIREAKKVDEDDMEEGNLFTSNLAKARADGKKEADLDGDGDMEKVRESVGSLWREYKGRYGV